jgi:hypothetical protein
MSWLALREVIVRDECQTGIAQAGKTYRRFDEAWEGLIWLIARNPRPAGSVHSTTDRGVDFFFYLAKGDADAGVPTIYIFYEFTDQRVTIHYFEAFDPAKSDEAE